MRTAIFFFLLPIIIHAQTNVSGFISANTTWTLAGSPYIVTGNTLLSHGYTLTIEPKVVVKFEDNTALQIDGELIAIGTPKNRITFTSNKNTPASGDWAKIHFPDTCVDAEFDIAGNYISGSIMQYCDVLYGGALGFGEIHIERASPYFNNCRIMNSYSAGIYAHRTHSWIESCLIKNCMDWGLNLINIDLNFTDVFIRNDTIENNMKGGISADYNQASGTNNVIIGDCYFMGNQGTGSILFKPGTQNWIVEKNVFEGNSGTAVISGSPYNTRISCNKFLNNTAQILKLGGGSPYSGVINNNLIESNSTSTADLIYISNVSVYPPVPTHFVNNIIRNNTSSQNCLRLELEMDKFNQTTIRKNSFYDNGSNITVSIRPYGGIYTGINYFLTMKQNTFSNPLSEYELQNLIPYGSSNMYIDSNYWGSTSTAHVDSVIYDYFDFANQSVVYYSPILSSPVELDTTCSPYVLPVAINEVGPHKYQAKVYPNPFSNQVTIEIADYEQTTILLYNFLGQQVLQQTFPNNTTINTEQLAEGIYIYELRNEAGTVKSGKVVKQ